MTLVRLTTGDIWDAEAGHAGDNGCHPEAEDTAWRRSREYISGFRERIPVLRAIRLKCGACMGGDGERMPLGNVAREIDECGSCMCPLWPFRFGADPWRAEVSPEQREAARASMRRLRGEPVVFPEASSPDSAEAG